jgi:hypothetical protein
MGVFSTLGKASAPFGSGAYFQDGKYLFQIRKVTQGESQRGEGPFVAVEGVIVEAIVSYPKSCVEGASISWIVMLRKQPAMSNLKGFFGAACGFSADCRFAYVGGTVTRASDGAVANAVGGQLVPVEQGVAWPDNAQDVTDWAWEAAANKAVAGAGDALAGIELIADALEITTKKGGKFTRVTWSQPPDEAATT